MTADFKQGTNLAGKILASARVASAVTDTTIYTVPASTAAKIASAVLCNTGGATATVSVSVVPSGGSIDGTHKIVHNYPLAAGDSMVVNELVGAMLGTGAFVSVNVSVGAVICYLLTGVESS